MELTPTQLVTALRGSCFALRFLVDEKCREATRQQMAGFSDAALFHRRMDLTWTLDEPEVLAAVARDERTMAIAFKAAFDALPWSPIDTHPFISDLTGKAEELAKLRPAAQKLLELRERRISLIEE